MSEPIKVGDLVVVVRTDCSGSAALSLGWIRAVQSINSLPSYRKPYCEFCEKSYGHEDLACLGKAHIPFSWLKRIPPLSELEGEKRDEEITA